jgi:hypothetical protein
LSDSAQIIERHSTASVQLFRENSATIHRLTYPHEEVELIDEEHGLARHALHIT